MSWALLGLAGALEVVGVAGFERTARGRYASGLALGLLGFGVGLTCLRLAMADIPMAVAYGVYTGIGALGASLVGIVCWGDSARPQRLLCIAAVVIAIIGLKATV